MKVKFTVQTSMIGSRVSDTLELDDDTTEEDLEEYFKDWVWQNIDANYSVVDGEVLDSSSPKKKGTK